MSIRNFCERPYGRPVSRGQVAEPRGGSCPEDPGPCLHIVSATHAEWRRLPGRISLFQRSISHPSCHRNFPASATLLSRSSE